MSDYRKSFAHICESSTCDNCKFNIDENEQYTCSYEGFYKHGYQQGRADEREKVDSKLNQLEELSRLYQKTFDWGCNDEVTSLYADAIYGIITDNEVFKECIAELKEQTEFV